jgi:DNA-binding transcriptional MerR regulator
VYIDAMSSNDQPLLTIDELAADTGVPVRTIRFYIAEGLLPGASTRGKGPSYSREHLERLQLIRLLVARHLPLMEIRTHMTQLPPSEVRAVLEEERARAGEVEAHTSMPTSPKAFLSALLEQARGYSSSRGTDAVSLGSDAAAPPKTFQPREEVEAQLGQSPKPTGPLVPAPPEPSEQSPYVRGSSREQGGQGEQGEQALAWYRLELAPGIELQVRADVARTDQEVIERLLQTIRTVLAHSTVDAVNVSRNQPQQEE